MNREFRVAGNNGPLGFLGPLLILTVFFAILFFIARGIFKLLAFVTPVLLIITLILDYRVVADFLQSVWNLLKKSPLTGILAIGLGIFVYPVIVGYLFFKALGKRNMKKMYETIDKDKNTYTDYEEVEDVVEDTSFLELPQLNKKGEKPAQEENKYDRLF